MSTIYVATSVVVLNIEMWVVFYCLWLLMEFYYTLLSQSKPLHSNKKVGIHTQRLAIAMNDTCKHNICKRAGLQPLQFKSCISDQARIDCINVHSNIAHKRIPEYATDACKPPFKQCVANILYWTQSSRRDSNIIQLLRPYKTWSIFALLKYQ